MLALKRQALKFNLKNYNFFLQRLEKLTLTQNFKIKVRKINFKLEFYLKNLEKLQKSYIIKITQIIQHKNKISRKNKNKLILIKEDNVKLKIIILLKSLN